eukprot:TRINITY_DN3316_c0_g1_i2.p1 TRINITY_DN3316_c0_g1~~TRINITY_DN3316_c0_g1_i2.p1  ORF type:complete len:347 (-),score=60.63 TRINITY_DN3316_c0_g1_i2:177-1217(-)
MQNEPSPYRTIRPSFKLSSLFRVWCLRTHSNGEKKLRIYEDEDGAKRPSPRHETVPEYPMPFTFVETSINNISIYIQPLDPTLTVSSVSLMVCDNRNQRVSACLRTKCDRMPKDVLEAELGEEMHTFKLIGVCKTSAQVYDSNVSGFLEHNGALLHPVLVMRTSVGVIEAHLPEFWSVSNSPHRQREVNAFRMMMETFRICDGALPECCERLPNSGRERRQRGGVAFIRGKYIMELTNYLDTRSEIFWAEALYQGRFPRKLRLKSQDETLFQQALEEYKIATQLSKLKTCFLEFDILSPARMARKDALLSDSSTSTLNVAPTQQSSTNQQDADGGSEETEIISHFS